jgi:hypothetical protein
VRLRRPSGSRRRARRSRRPADRHGRAGTRSLSRLRAPRERRGCSGGARWRSRSRRVLRRCGRKRPAVQDPPGRRGPRSEDDQRRPGGSELGQVGQVPAQVTSDDRRWMLARHGARRAQPLEPLELSWPDECLEPAHLRGVVEVDRVQVEPGPPDHLNVRARQRRGRVGAAMKGGRLSLGRGDPGAYAVAAVDVLVMIGPQAQAGGCTDLEQGQRLGQLGQQGQQGGATSRFVGLSATRRHHCGNLIRVGVDPLDEASRVRRGAVEVAHRSDQQVGLPLGRRHLGQEGDADRVSGHRLGDLGEQRRLPWRLDVAVMSIQRHDLI